MLKNVSYKNKRLQEEIDLTVGKEYSLLQRIKMGGNGSRRMNVASWSHDFEKLFTMDSRIKYCSFELRPKGVIIRFRSILETYAWIIPYYKLTIFQSREGFSMHSDGKKMTIRRNYKDEVEKAFFSKLLKHKTNFLENLEGDLIDRL